jgi:hypothetical protein
MLFTFYFLLQISLVDLPEHQRKKLLALTTNVMRDDSDKVKNGDLILCSGSLNLPFPSPWGQKIV